MADTDRDEALRQIAEISGVIKSSNTLMFPGRGILPIGIAVLLIPLIELPTKSLSFGADLGPNHWALLSVVHVIFYFFYFNGIRWAVKAIWKQDPKDDAHPLIVRSLDMERPILFAIAGLIVVLVSIGQGHLAYPMVYILLGILFNLYGRLSRPMVLYISWSYIVLGLLYAALSVYQNMDMWLPFNTYLGATLIVMGYSAWKNGERKPA